MTHGHVRRYRHSIEPPQHPWLGQNFAGGIVILGDSVPANLYSTTTVRQAFRATRVTNYAVPASSLMRQFQHNSGYDPKYRWFDKPGDEHHNLARYLGEHSDSRTQFIWHFGHNDPDIFKQRFREYQYIERARALINNLTQNGARLILFSPLSYHGDINNRYGHISRADLNEAMKRITAIYRDLATEARQAGKNVEFVDTMQAAKNHGFDLPRADYIHPGETGGRQLGSLFAAALRTPDSSSRTASIAPAPTISPVSPPSTANIPPPTATHPNGVALLKAARELEINPSHLAGIISRETAGTSGRIYGAARRANILASFSSVLRRAKLMASILGPTMTRRRALKSSFSGRS